MQTFVYDDFHHPQSQRTISARARLDVPIGHHRRAGHARVNDDQLHAALARFLYERDGMHASAHQIGAPQYDDLGFLTGLMDGRAVGNAVGINTRPHRRVDADRLLQPRRIHPIPETLVHTPVAQHTERAGIRVRLHRLGTVFRDDRLHVVGDRLQSLVPADALKLRVGAFGSHPLMRIENAVIVIHQLNIMIDLVA